MTGSDRTNTTLRGRAVLGGAIAAAVLAVVVAKACADPVDLRVVDRDTGQELRTWRHHGRLFVAGEPGERYGLRVTNHTGGRLLVVLSVDGVNVLTGETAAWDQRGYVFDAYASDEVSGWRKSNSEIAAFAFAPLPQSYAARTGRPDDVGVIGMAVFKERAAQALYVPAPYVPSRPIWPEWRDEPSGGLSGRAGAPSSFAGQPAPAPPPLSMAPSNRGPSRAAIAGSANAAAPAEVAGGYSERRYDDKLGTAHGAREWSVVYDTAFVRATRYPLEIRQIEYDTHDNLVASGVIPASPYAEGGPRPFPVNPDGGGFVPDPPPEP